MKKRVAVLALQGAFLEHERMVQSLGAECIELRQASDLTQPFEALILPGGESTAQTKLLVELEMLQPLKTRIETGMPTLGTCSGIILLANRVEDPNDRTGERTTYEGVFGTLDVTVERNAFGRQLGSSRVNGYWHDANSTRDNDMLLHPTDEREVPLTLIRAPRIVSLGPKAKPLVTLDGQPVGVQQGNQIGLTYHPELDSDPIAHELLLSLA